MRLSGWSLELFRSNVGMLASELKVWDLMVTELRV